MSEFLVWRDFNESDVAELEGLPASERRAYLSKRLVVPNDFSLEPRRSLYVDFCTRNVTFAVNSGMHGAKVSALTSLLGDTLQWACGLIEGSVPEGDATAKASDESDTDDQQVQEPNSTRSQASEASDVDAENTEETPTGDASPESATKATDEARPGKEISEAAPAAVAEDGESSDKGTGEANNAAAANVTDVDVDASSRPATAAASSRSSDDNGDVDASNEEEQQMKSSPPSSPPILLPTVDSTLAYFDSLLLKHAVERPPFSVGVYSLADVKAITNHAVETLFANFELYRVAFVPDKCAASSPQDGGQDPASSPRSNSANGSGEAGDETQGNDATPRGDIVDDARAAADDSATGDSQLAKEMEKLRREFAISMEQQREMLEEKLSTLEEKFK